MSKSHTTHGEDITHQIGRLISAQINMQNAPQFMARFEKEYAEAAKELAELLDTVTLNV